LQHGFMFGLGIRCITQSVHWHVDVINCRLFCNASEDTNCRRLCWYDLVVNIWSH